MLALGQLGLNEEELGSMTLRTFNNLIEGHEKQLKQLSQERWEIARWVNLYSISPHSKKTLRPTDIVTFPWEKQKKPPLDKAKLDEIIEKASKHIKTNE